MNKAERAGIGHDGISEVLYYEMIYNRKIPSGGVSWMDGNSTIHTRSLYNQLWHNALSV